jgi:predicted enzyme related to lactoylglutathione lyase
VAWQDLTVPNAEAIRDFYAVVVGWRPEPVDMGACTPARALTACADDVSQRVALGGDETDAIDLRPRAEAGRQTTCR